MKFDWRKIIIPLLLAGLLLPAGGLAFDDLTTHPALTDETIDFYNLFAPEKISQEEKEAIIAGAKSEDVPPRWINHFYDPIYNIGWSGEKMGIWPAVMARYFSKAVLSLSAPASSLNWLHNQKLQSDYARYGGNRTWERAVYEYANGNKQEAYYTLGYILHLIEDAAVPDHTRNDTHAHEARFATGDYGSPLEEFAKQFNRNSLNIADDLKAKGLKPLALNSIDNYLIDLARYSNGYFFSKDTINDPKYNNPKIIREDENFGYGRDKNGEEFKLIRITNKTIKDDNKFIKIKLYTLIEEKGKEIIMPTYFSRLSREAIIYGAGVIELFHREVNDILAGRKQAPEIFGAQPKSFWRKLVTFDIGNISVVGESHKAAGLYEDIKTNVLDAFSDVDVSKQLAGAAGAIPSIESNTQNNSELSELSAPNAIAPSDLRLPDTPLPKKQKIETIKTNPPPPDLPANNNLNNNPIYSAIGLLYPGFGGGAPAPSTKTQELETPEPEPLPEPEPEPPADTAAPSSPVITSPADFYGIFTSADITFSGAAEASSTVSNNLNSATATVDSLGNWSLAFSFNQGTTTVEFFAADAAGNISSSTSVAVFVDSVAPDVAISVAGCENSLWADGCLLATTTLNISWTSSAGDVDYYEFDNNGSVSATTSTSTSVAVLDNSSNSFSARVKDKAGHWSATSTAAAEVFLMPIVINELAWAEVLA